MSNGIRWSAQEYETWLYKQARGQGANNSALPVADAKRDPNHEPATKNAAQEVYPGYRIRFHSRRRRLCDPDGLYSKAALDGIVRGGVLPDDGPGFVKEVRYSQEKSKIEETVITVEILN